MRLRIKLALQFRNSCGKSHNLPMTCCDGNPFHDVFRMLRFCFSVLDRLGVCVEVEISSLFQAVQKLLPLPFFPAAILDFRWKEWSDFSGDGTTEEPVPENEGIDTGIVSVSCRWAKLEGGTNVHPHRHPRCSRYKKAPQFAG